MYTKSCILSVYKIYNQLIKKRWLHHLDYQYLINCISAPAIADLAADGSWANEFLAAEKSAPNDAHAWEVEFNAVRQSQLPDDAGVKWAAQYLDQAEHHRW